jgi:hypothetical protein
MKSKKQSGTKREPPEPITYFVDRCLGHRVGELLRAAGSRAEIHDDHFPDNAPDVEWIPVVAGRGWVILSKDKGIRRRPLELARVIESKARFFALAASKGLTGEQMAQVFIDNRARMERLARKQPPPFVAGVYPDRVTLYEIPTAMP